jgi:AcrR family transcriptional regulator
MARPSTPILSRRRIARAALELIDDEGFEALTTRRLAKRLGVEGPSLYNHIRSRDDLLDEVHAAVLEDQFSPMGRDADWRAELESWARQYRRALARHPHVLSAIARRPITTRASLRLYDELFAFLDAHGFDARAATAISAAIEFLVLGAAIEAYADGFDKPPAVYAEDYPHLARALADGQPQTVDDRGFELGLQAMLNHFALLRTP